MYFKRRTDLSSLLKESGRHERHIISVSPSRILSLVTAFCILSSLVLDSCVREKRTNVNLQTREYVSNADSSAGESLEIGVAAMFSPEYALPAYEKIVSYIGKKMGVTARMVFTKDYASMNEMVKQHRVAAAFVCSGPYVSAHDEWGMEIIAAASLYGSASYFSYIIVNKASTASRLEDLRGKRFAFTDPQSNTGRLVPEYELALKHETPESFFSDFIYTGSHDKSIEAVAEGFVDGAAVDNLIWEYMNKTDSTFTSRTRIIAKLGPYCIPPFVTNPECNPEIKAKLKSVLLSMDKDPEGKAILDMIFIDRFIEVNDDCYQSIREMNSWIKKRNESR